MGINNLSKNDKKLMLRMFSEYPEFFLNITKSLEEAKDYFIEDMKEKEDWDNYREWWEKEPRDYLDEDPYIEQIESRVIERAVDDFEEELNHYDFECFVESITGGY